MQPNNFYQEVKELAKRIDDTLREELIVPQQEATAVGAGDLAKAAIEFAERGGKRLRGILALIGHRAFQPENHNAYLLATAIELFHAYLLVHDDIMDNDEIRRGGPTLHVVFAKQHQNSKLGESLGILGGDLLSAWAQSLLQRSAGTSHLGVLSEFNRAHTRVIYGQKLDVAPRASSRAEDVTKAHDLKTGEYSFLMPLRVGAMLAGATETQMTPFTPYALHLGRAFQAKDDLLGMFGDPVKLGKSIGTDILVGKHNWLVTDVLQNAPHQQERLLQILRSSAAPQTRIMTAQAIIRDSGARERCEKYIQQEIQTAQKAILATTLQGNTASFLESLAHFVGNRES
jgi:geranylgeranyl diphosphate synthase, type I